MAKKRGKGKTKKSRANPTKKNKELTWKYLIGSLILFVIFLVLCIATGNVFLSDLFYLLSMVFGFVALAFLIIILIFIFMKAMKKK